MRSPEQAEADNVSDAAYQAYLDVKESGGTEEQAMVAHRAVKLAAREAAEAARGGSRRRLAERKAFR